MYKSIQHAASASLVTLLMLASSVHANNYQVVQVHIKNSTNDVASIYYKYGNQEVPYGYVNPGRTITANSYLGVCWGIRGNRCAAGGTVMQANQTIELVCGNAAVTPNRPQPARANLRLNQGVLNYCNSVVGRTVGNGQCTELAMQALRSAGACLPQQGYDWGQPLRGTHELQPGDIIQLWNATFAWGSTSQHTAVVTGVQGSVIHLLEQNVAGSPVQAGTLDVREMRSGRIDCFRPKQCERQPQFSSNPQPSPRYDSFPRQQPENNLFPLLLSLFD